MHSFISQNQPFLIKTFVKTHLQNNNFTHLNDKIVHSTFFRKLYNEAIKYKTLLRHQIKEIPRIEINAPKLLTLYRILMEGFYD